MSKKIRLIIFQLFLMSVIGFWFYMAALCAIRSSIDYNNLIHVKGIVKGFRHIKHYESPGKFERERRGPDVIAFKVVGFDDEFGIMERDDNYTTLRDVLNYSDSNTIDMYYDPKEQRIEDGITLHIFELIIDDSVVVTLQDTKNSERKGILIFGLIGLCVLVSDIYLIKEHK